MVTLASVLENLDLVEVLVTFLAPGDVFRLASCDTRVPRFYHQYQYSNIHSIFGEVAY